MAFSATWPALPPSLEQSANKAQRSPIEPVSHSEPAVSDEKFVLYQPEQLPPPRPVVPKLGAEPPPPPKELPPLVGSPASVGGPLRLEEVLESVERHYPLLRAIEQERAITGGRLLSTLGVFDFNLLASAEGQGTTYDNFRSGAGFNQMLPIAGLGLFAGYRHGAGDFPTYNLAQKTADGGEFRAGFTLPLLRDRAIDRPRANVQQARLDRQIAEPTIERQRIDFQLAAARTYWNWVAAGQRLKVVDGLVNLALERDEQLKRQVELERIANIERIDNQQNLALRYGLLIQAQRAFQQASIELSLFLRDEMGQPTLASLERLPEFPAIEPVDIRRFEEALRIAFELRPEPRRLRLQRDRAAIEYELARNHLLPAVNAVVAASQDVGPGKSTLSGPNGLDRTNLSAGLAFQLPVQRRDAQGRMLAAQGLMIQLEQQLRQAEDVVRAEVQDTFTALERAYEFYQQAKNRVELARIVARGERELLRQGRSTVLAVTLREQAAFDAEVIEIDAQLNYFRALAAFRAALGIGGK